jgi:23S rRNA (cytidine2498-2'-O)-methyltransferase
MPPVKKKKTTRSTPAPSSLNVAKPKKAPRVAAPCAITYCRAGFESDAAEELAQAASERGIAGTPVFVPGTAFALFVPTEARDLDRLRSFVRLQDLIFARQLIWSSGIVASLPADDRVTPIVEQVIEHLVPATENSKFARLMVEPADSDSGKELSKFCTALARPLENALRKQSLLPKSTPKVAWDPTLHVFMLDASCVYIGFSDADNSSTWPMGIPRLRFPAGAPSRAALKLEEAFKTFLTPEEESTLMPEGSTAVDLGAAPGGWTALLVQKGVYVTAVDNGSLDPALLRSDQVEHIREDAFKFRPEEAVHWLFCDVVESPARVAALMANWLDRRLAKHAIFNLKLPMKKRIEEIKACLAHLERVNLGKGKRLRLQVKQLYHDRSEVTVCATNPGLKK